MKKILLFIAFICGMVSESFAVGYTSSQSGLFSATSTWGGAGFPHEDGDTWTIGAAHTVWYDSDNSAHAGFGNSTLTGTLSITNGLTAHIKMNGNIAGTGSFLIGTEATPIAYSTDHLTPPVVIQFVAGQVTMTCTNQIKWYANTNGFNDYITNTMTVAGDSTNMWFAGNVSNVASNDVVYIDNQRVQGVAGSVHVVYSVETNRITLFNAITGSAATVTNTWFGVVFLGPIATNTRTNGTQVTLLSRPVVVYQPTKISATGVFNGANTNTLLGVRFTNLGRGTLSTRNNWVITSCVGNNNANGGIAYYGSGHVITSCVGNNNSQGGIVNSGSGHVITSCIGNNNANGGIAYYGSGHVITSCVGNNNANGGIANLGSGHVITSCVGNNNTSGGIAYYGSGHVITSCVGNNNTSGGIAYYGSQTIINCTTTNQSVPLLAYYPNFTTIYDTNSLSFATAVTLISGNVTPFDVTLYNGTNWNTDAGMVATTNLGATFSPTILAHFPTSFSKPVSCFIGVGTKTSATRKVGLWTFGTNGVQYNYCVTRIGEIPITLTPVTYTTSGWVLNSVSITNTLAQPTTYRLWVTSYHTNSNVGFSWVDVPTDLTTVYQ